MAETAARRAPYRSRCLEQALTLWWLLRRQGIVCDLRLGVRRQAGGIEAHAWVEHPGLDAAEIAEVRASFAPFHPPLATPGPPLDRHLQ